MSPTKRLLVTAALIAGLAAGSAGAAHASASLKETWNRGVTGVPGNGTSYSHYYHPTKCHGATAVGKHTVRTPNIAAGQWARANAPRAIGNNQAYRRTC
ncbi:lactococcin 972 family bacteriocin [Nocardiopsis prasina]|uniref:lactococcin 972 family bacteriocin n=1 Tax=Nocardiopsis prasina TaxID=2015 RepID=UPI00034DCAA7|nr:lactococcin 972 family bacteriocin [Nocardiopsis prasina]